MTERTARVAAPDALALFAALSALMTDRAAAVALASAAVTTAIGLVLAWRRVTRWPLIAGLAVAAGCLVLLGHHQSANLSASAGTGTAALAGPDLADRRFAQVLANLTMRTPRGPGWLSRLTSSPQKRYKRYKRYPVRAGGPEPLHDGRSPAPSTSSQPGSGSFHLSVA